MKLLEETHARLCPPSAPGRKQPRGQTDGRPLAPGKGNGCGEGRGAGQPWAGWGCARRWAAPFRAIRRESPEPELRRAMTASSDIDGVRQGADFVSRDVRE